MFDERDLDGRRILVTGGSIGIGLEVSRELACRGARVVIAARSVEAIDAGLSRLDGSGHQALQLDVSDERAWQAAIAEIDTAGSLHGLVTAAGMLGPIGQLEDLLPSEIAKTIAVNLTGTMLALHHAIPRLRRSNGRAVTFSGGGGTSPLPRYDAYAASKAAVVRLTENVAAYRRCRAQLRGSGVRGDAHARPDAACRRGCRRHRVLRAHAHAARRWRLSGAGKPLSSSVSSFEGFGRHHRSPAERAVGPAARGGIPRPPPRRP